MRTGSANPARRSDPEAPNETSAERRQPGAMLGPSDSSCETRAYSPRRSGRAFACNKRVRSLSSAKREARRPWPAQEETLT